MKSILASLAAVILFSCNAGDDYQTSPNGLKYKLITEEKNPKAQPGQYIAYHVAWRTMNDSLLFTSEGKTEPLLSLVARPIYDGDPWEIFTMLGAGDSASCKVPAKNIFKNHLPASLQPTDPIKLDVKVIAVYSAQQYDSLKMAAVNAQLNREDQAFQTYLRKNGLQGTKTPSGMYIAITTPGKGKQATQGSTVLVDYTGKLMNGEQFDSSMQPGREPYEVVIGQSSVIQGWHEGLTYFNTGAKGQILIPSRLAYGERGNPPRIGSNEPLVFEIEMVEVR